MAEEGQAEGVVTATVTKTEGVTSVAEPVPFADAEGNLRENWYADDDDLKEHGETLKRFKNVKPLAKSFMQVRKMVGTDLTAIPTDKFTEKDWDAWHDAGGRPSTAADFNFKKPDDFPEELWSDSRALEWMEFLHKIGISENQAKSIFEKNNGDILVGDKSLNDAIAISRQEVKDGLYKDWGNAYESKNHLGNLAIEHGCKGATATPEGDAEFKARLCDKFGDDPDFIRYSSNLGGKFAEHGSITVSQVPTPGDIQSQITEIMAKPEYSHRDKKVRQPLIDQVMTLRNQLNKSKGTT